MAKQAYTVVRFGQHGTMRAVLHRDPNFDRKDWEWVFEYLDLDATGRKRWSSFREPNPDTLLCDLLDALEDGCKEPVVRWCGKAHVEYMEIEEEN